MKHVLFFLISARLLGQISVHAQEDCKNALYEANILFETGKLQASIDRLDGCINRSMTKEERFESFRLLALAYQNLNDLENAEAYILEMLHMKPDYQQVPNNDPQDFTRLVEQFEVTRKIESGIKMGMSFNNPKLLQSYSLFQTPQKYFAAPGFTLGIFSDYLFTPNWHLRGSVLFKGTAIRHELINESGWKKFYVDNIRLWELNLAPRYYLSKSKKLLPFLGASIGIGKMTSSRIIMETTHPDGQVEYNSQDGLAFKKSMQSSMGLLAGISLPLARGFAELEIGYSWYLNMVTRDEKRFDNTEFIFNTQYVADDIRMRVLEISINYSLPHAYRITKR